MISDFYNNDSVSLYNNSKETNIEEVISYIYYNYLPIIMDINKYSQKLHENILQIYPPSNIIITPLFLKFTNMKNNLKECDNKNNNNILVLCLI